MSFANTPLYEGDGCLCAMPLPTDNAATSLATGPGALELKVWTRRIDAIWAVFEVVAHWYREEPKPGQDRQAANYLSETKARKELSRSLRDLDRGIHLPV